MRQLAKENISLLPVLLEDCEIPPLLADIKFADFRSEFDKGFSGLYSAISSKKSR